MNSNTTAKAPHIRRAFGIFAAMMLAATCARADSEQWQPLTYDASAPGLDANPVRGLMPFTYSMTSSFPHSLVFDYLPLRAVMTGSNEFDWSALESSLKKASGAGYQEVVRFYLDYPNFAAGTPQFLIDQGVTMRDYTDYSNGARAHSETPDWNDTRVITACQQFIAAFGKAYDGDPRIGIVQLGLYGFWGEWHTYPYEGSSGHPNWQMTAANKGLLLTAYKDAFRKTQLCLRDPAATLDAPLKTSFGYHDDSFAYSTLAADPAHSYYFWPRMQAASLNQQWMRRSMGGELRPELQEQKYWSHWPNAVGEDWTTCVNTTHVSWMLCESVFDRSGKSSRDPLSAEEWSNALRGHRLLGYQFYVSQAQLPNTTQKNPLNVGIKIKNLGNAPAPYNWAGRFAVLDSANTIVTTPWGDNVDVQLTSIPPDGVEYARTFTKPNHGLASGDYTMVFQLRHPLPNGKIAFANSEMDRNLSGWLTLGKFSVVSSADRP